ncbi:M15 family metallopeptidase [Cellulomonas endophytica]|uniref:M15 family metallopeptidase n=1 Tax=Cellulomonas endophytica TaxID=2494735 RepID=UPI001010FDF4|nr:M15 family metallopeptidase [Cellulomonas endophytica]
MATRRARREAERALARRTASTDPDDAAPGVLPTPHGSPLSAPVPVVGRTTPPRPAAAPVPAAVPAEAVTVPVLTRRQLREQAMRERAAAASRSALLDGAADALVASGAAAPRTPAPATPVLTPPVLPGTPAAGRPVRTVVTSTGHDGDTLTLRRVDTRTRRSVAEATPSRRARRTAAAPARPARRTATRVGALAALVVAAVAVPVVQGLTGEEAASPAVAAVGPHLPSTVTALAPTASGTGLPASLASTTVERALASASRAEVRGPLPDCTGIVVNTGAANGRLPLSDLCTLWDGTTEIRADAAVAAAELNQAFRARFGEDLCLSSGYRTYAQQVAVKATRGGLAAAPGKSNHGWGLAIDLCSGETTGARWTWMNANAGTYGWENPDWAQPGGSGPYERWHWEYLPGVMADGEYYGS